MLYISLKAFHFNVSSPEAYLVSLILSKLINFRTPHQTNKNAMIVKKAKFYKK